MEQEAATTEKLQKVLARLGIASRRAAEEMILEGRVQVNDEIATLGQRVTSTTDLVVVDGVRISIKPDLVYYLLYKPTDVISTASDPQGRKTVVDLVPDKPRVFPVGRLDRETEGLLLLTNDGDMTHRLTHPSFGVPKEYFVSVEMTLTAPGCGMGDILMQDVKEKIEIIPIIQEANVELVFDPPWNQSMMSETARLEAGLL